MRPMKMSHVLIMGALLTGCGGGAMNVLPSKPVSQPEPPPTPPTMPEPEPPPAPPPPPIDMSPTIVTLGPGANPMIDGAGDVAWQNGANIEPMLLPGQLTDWQAGHALEYEIDPVSQLVSLRLDNEPVPGAANVDLGGARLTSDGLGAAWTSGGTENIWLDGIALAPPSDVGYEELSVAGSHVAWALMPGGGQTCQVYVDGQLVMDDQKGECFDLTLRVEQGAMWVGWADGLGVTVASSVDGKEWVSLFQIGGLDSVYGASYNVGSDGRAIVAWIQLDDSTGASAIWRSIGGDHATRISALPRLGANGAGNPAVLADGTVAWLDDSDGQAASGDYDVWVLRLSDTTPTRLTDGTHQVDSLVGVATSAGAVLAWSDTVTVWSTSIGLVP